MPLYLVIVESPAKCKKIEGFLGKNYVCKASYGHVMELGKGLECIDINNHFTPTYQVIPSKRNVLKELKTWTAKADEVYLASDPDREGEAIAYSLAKYLGILKTGHRISFNEITKTAVTEAIQRPTRINMDIYHAQVARRVLDRLIGFEISPLLWNAITSSMGLSAGRCQAPALHFVQDREQSIETFQTTPYYAIQGTLQHLADPKDTSSSAYTLQVQYPERLASKDQCSDILTSALVASFSIQQISEHDRTSSPSLPFTTSSLQQEASNIMKFKPKQTMQMAQNLYEAGYITYMRSDSTTMSNEAITALSAYIQSSYGDAYYNPDHGLGGEAEVLDNGKGKGKGKSKSKGKGKGQSQEVSHAQEAHECIRPVDIGKASIPASDEHLHDGHRKLYRLIWKRSVSACMTKQKRTERVLTIEARDKSRVHSYQTKEDHLVFDGWTRVYDYGSKPSGWSSAKLHDTLNLDQLRGDPQETKPKPRYTPASLIKQLEKSGIGRPSTYSNIISTLLDRQYMIEMDGSTRTIDATVLWAKKDREALEEIQEKKRTASQKGKLQITALGQQVDAFLKKHFPDLLDKSYTAAIESDLDKISRGDEVWYDVVYDVYQGFHPKVVSLSGHKKTNTNRSKIGTDGTYDYYKMRTKYGLCVLRQEPSKRKGVFKPLAECVFGRDAENITFQEVTRLYDFPILLSKKDGVYLCYGSKGFYLKKVYKKKDKKKDLMIQMEGNWATRKPKVEECVRLVAERIAALA